MLESFQYTKNSFANKTNSSVSNKAEFYQNFLEFRDVNWITIDNYEIKNDGKKDYAAYKINVTTMDLTYLIEKRYSDFDLFYYNAYQNCSKIETLDFPGKKLFGNFAKEFLQERKEKLEEFLNEVRAIYKENKLIVFLEFLAIYENYQQSNININCFSSLKLCKQYAATKDDLTILEFIIKMNIYHHDRLQTFNKINDFLFEKKPKISTKVVEILIKGETNTKGLLQILTDSHKNNHLVCAAGLKLFCSCFNHEHNKAADFFINIFLNIKREDFFAMNLEEHILDYPAKNCKEYGLKLLQYYLDNYPEVENYFMINEKRELYDEYIKYKQRKNLVFLYDDKRIEGEYYKISYDNASTTSGDKNSLFEKKNVFNKNVISD